MPFINLIQEQRLAQQREERKARSLFTLFAGTLAASVALYGFVSFENGRLAREAATLQQEIERVAPLLAQIDKNDAERMKLVPRLKTLEDAQATSERWSRILYHVSTQTPPQVWLTNLRCQASDPTKPVLVMFQGMSTNQDSVGELILRVQNAEDLENVNLKFTQEKLVNNMKSIEFQVEADVVGTATAKPTTVEGKL